MISKAFTVALCLAALVFLGFPAAAQAQSVIKQPGNHPDYSFEIEPHLAFQWAGRIWGSDGFGPGVRFNIPFMHNGPIKTINNNMGITFGADLTFGGGGWGCYPADRRYPGADCSVTEFWLPVAMQWNFFLTKVISVFGEPGFAIAHRRWSYPWYCNGLNQATCDVHVSDTTLEPVFSGGARFMFSDTVGATVRLGYPMLTAGINILL
jgi:hypothetical protein